MNPFVEGRNAGISMIPVRPHSKIPAVSWKDFQLEICSELQAIEWGSNGHNFGVGAVTGEVSGRLMAIDIEVSFMPRLAELGERMRAAGLEETFNSWVSGYSESTPRGGLHILVRLEGEGKCPINERFAVDAADKVLIETRGEGGYVLVAPTVGYKVTGGGFDQIVYCTLEEWARVEAVLRSFDEASEARPALTVAPRSTGAFGGSLGGGDGWIDNVKAGLPSIRSLLEDRGWVFPGTSDQFGTHVVRPGKQPREGHSANLSHDGYLYVHSTNTDLPTGVGLDAVDIMWCWEHGRRDRPPTLGERTDWLQARRPPLQAGVGAASGGGLEVADLNLSPAFWETRGYLTHVKQAALADRVSPDAAWEIVKCFYGATIPWNHRLPRDGTFDYISMIAGKSGSGKSLAKQTAYNLLPDLQSIAGIAFPAPAGTGEGITATYLDDTNPDNKYAYRGIGWYCDEAKFILDIAARTGNTTMQAFKQGWSGELTGSVAATKERHRWLNPRDVRFTLAMSVTTGVAARFLASDLTDEGLPQRISWAWAEYPHPDQAPNHPGPLQPPIWDHNQADGIYTLELEPELAHLIDTRQLALARGQDTTDGLEGHATYATLKNAGIHTHLDHRLTITIPDWELATQEWANTQTIRHHIAASAQQANIDHNTATGTARAHQQIAETNVHLEKAVHSLIRKLKNSKQAFNNRQVKDHLAPYRQRHGITHREIIDLAIGRGLLDYTDEGYRPT